MNAQKTLLEQSTCWLSNEMVLFTFADDFTLTPDGLRYLGIMEAMKPATIKL